MEKNIGSTHRLLRIAGVALIGLLVYLQVLSGTLGVVFSFVAMFLTLTSIRGYCPVVKLWNSRAGHKR